MEEEWKSVENFKAETVTDRHFWKLKISENMIFVKEPGRKVEKNKWNYSFEEQFQYEWLHHTYWLKKWTVNNSKAAEINGAFLCALLLELGSVVFVLVQSLEMINQEK